MSVHMQCLTTTGAVIGIAALAADREARPQVLALAGGIAAAGAIHRGQRLDENLDVGGTAIR